MAQRLPRLTADEIIRVPRRNGFELISQRGSHQKWRHPNSGRQGTVPFHRGRQLPLRTINAIIDGSGDPATELTATCFGAL
jgi:predicted RNA binding protein YcfA (HicA-like mRNA interferase family)